MSQKPLPLGEVSPKVTERARTLTEMSEHSDNIALIKAFDYRCIPSLLSHACPLRRSAPALPKGEPLQRVSFTFCYYLLLYQSNKSKL